MYLDKVLPWRKVNMLEAWALLSSEMLYMKLLHYFERLEIKEIFPKHYSHHRSVRG